MPKLRHKQALLGARSRGTKPVVGGGKKTEEDEGAIGGNLSHARGITLWRKRDVCYAYERLSFSFVVPSNVTSNFCE